MEKNTNVKPVKVTYTCVDCGVGIMKFTSVIYPMYPPSYEHKCDVCCKTKRLDTYVSI